MIKIIQTKEILISTKNKIGLLLEISEVLISQGSNIRAISAHASGNFALVGLITEDNQKTLKILREKEYNVVENGVILLEMRDKVGVLNRITNALKTENIDIISVYGGGITDTDKGILVFSTTDNSQAYTTLKSLNSK